MIMLPRSSEALATEFLRNALADDALGVSQLEATAPLFKAELATVSFDAAKAGKLSRMHAQPTDTLVRRRESGKIIPRFSRLRANRLGLKSQPVRGARGAPQGI